MSKPPTQLSFRARPQNNLIKHLVGWFAAVIRDHGVFQSSLPLR